MSDSDRAQPGKKKDGVSSSSTTHELLRDLLYYVPAKVVPAVAAFVLVILLTHSLPPEQYGKYAVVIAAASLSATLGFTWLRQSILRYYPDYRARGKTQDFQASILPISILISVAELAIASITLWALRYDLVQIILALFLLGTVTPLNLLITLYQSHRFSRSYAIATLLQATSQVIWILGFVWLAGKGYAFAVLAIGVGNLAATLYLLTLRAKTHIFSDFRFGPMDLSLVRRMMAYGLPMSIWLFSLQMVVQGNRFILGLYSQEEVGLFASAYDLINGSLSLLMTPFLLATHPLVMQMWAETRDHRGIERLLSNVTRYLLILCMPIFTLSLAINESFFFLLGERYGVEGWIVPILVASVFVGQFSMYAHKGLEVANRTSTMMWTGLLTAGLNIALNVIFVGQYGYQASAVILLCSNLFYMLVVYQFSRRFIKLLVPWRSVLRTGIAAVLSYVCWLLLNRADAAGASNPVVWFFASTLLSIIVYLLAILISGELAPEVRGMGHWIAQRRLGQGTAS